MKKTIVPLVLALALAQLWAEDIAVRVLDADLGLPLEGARLQGTGIAAVATDADGRATVTLPDGKGRVAITAVLPGYESAKLWLKAGEGKVTFKLSIAGLVEGKELVVEKARPQKTDEQAGVSQVATREEIASTGEIGVVEDVMSTVKLMPGVGYVGGWDAMPSIRGGSPLETTAVLDGAYVLYPYQWGGAFSIFDPNMVESAKLSNGIISARYGRVLSGLLEVSSKSVKSSSPRLDVGVSTTGLNFFAQGGIGSDLDLMLGGKLTWMEVSFALAGQSGAFETVPYIRNGYARLAWKPSNRFEWYVNSFVGTDGIGARVDSPAGDSGMATKGLFTWGAISLIETTGVKLLVSDSSLFDLTFSYNNETTRNTFEEKLNGSRSYDPAFLADPTNAGLIAAVDPGATGFTLTDFEVAKGREDAIFDTYQGRASWDWEFLKGQVLSFGAESVLLTTSEKNDQTYWSDSFSSTGLPQYTQSHFELDSPANRQAISGAYALAEFNLFSGLLTGEAGLRVDHNYLYNDALSFNTNPTLNPRLRLELTPWKNLGWIESLGIVAGSGLYSQMPLLANLFDANMRMPSGLLKPDRAWFNVLGLDLNGADDWKVSIEGYYKLYFDRLYVVADRSANPATFIAMNDGEGYAYGADLLVQKRLGRYWDGWLTYSYSMAKYYNPMMPTYPGELTIGTQGQGNDPLGKWYYPAFQRFHTVHLVLDWKPKPGFTATLIGSLATGAPKQKVGEIVSYPSVYTDPATGKTQIIERFSRSSSYDDDLRNDLSCPVDLKLTWADYYPGTKVRWEYYIGVENVFANLYSPRTNNAFDPFTGKELSGSGQADFTIGFPIPSFGYKLSY